jgi:hypothetical protein
MKWPSVPGSLLFYQRLVEILECKKDKKQFFSRDGFIGTLVVAKDLCLLANASYRQASGLNIIEKDWCLKLCQLAAGAAGAARRGGRLPGRHRVQPVGGQAGRHLHHQGGGRPHGHRATPGLFFSHIHEKVPRLAKTFQNEKKSG